MTTAGEAISFTAVARTAGVSTDFLYGHPTLRTQIERHRTKHGPVRQTPAQVDTTSSSAAVRALSARLTEQTADASGGDRHVAHSTGSRPR